MFELFFVRCKTWAKKIHQSSQKWFFGIRRRVFVAFFRDESPKVKWSIVCEQFRGQNVTLFLEMMRFLRDPKGYLGMAFENYLVGIHRLDTSPT